MMSAGGGPSNNTSQHMLSMQCGPIQSSAAVPGPAPWRYDYFLQILNLDKFSIFTIIIEKFPVC